MAPESIPLSIAMLKEVITGKTYEAVAAQHCVSRTAVERRIKSLVRNLSREVGIEGIHADGPVFVRRLRSGSAAIMAALERYAPSASRIRCAGKIMTDEDILLAAQRTRARSTCPLRDVALLYLLLSTGARPLEIARLEVGDYLQADGSVREESVMRAEVAVNRKARPLFFSSKKTEEAINGYLAERLRQGFGIGKPCSHRGLDPHSRLFLSEVGAPFVIVASTEPGQMRFLCRGILDTLHGCWPVAPMKIRSARCWASAH